MSIREMLLPTDAGVKRLKKSQLVELCNEYRLDPGGTNAQLLHKLLTHRASIQEVNAHRPSLH